MRRRRRLPKPEYCARTGKRRWPSADAAVEVLHQAANRRWRARWTGESTNRHEVRHYLCPYCSGWHLTSQEG